MLKRNIFFADVFLKNEKVSIAEFYGLQDMD